MTGIRIAIAELFDRADASDPIRPGLPRSLVRFAFKLMSSQLKAVAEALRVVSGRIHNREKLDRVCFGAHVL